MKMGNMTKIATVASVKEREDELQGYEVDVLTMDRRELIEF